MRLDPKGKQLLKGGEQGAFAKSAWTYQKLMLAVVCDLGDIVCLVNINQLMIANLGKALRRKRQSISVVVKRQHNLSMSPHLELFSCYLIIFL